MLIEPFQRVTPRKFGFAEFGILVWKWPDPNARQSSRRPARKGNLSRTKWRKYDFQNTKRRFLSIAANLSSISVIPAQAGIQSPRQICLRPWIPACARMTERSSGHSTHVAGRSGGHGAAPERISPSISCLRKFQIPGAVKDARRAPPKAVASGDP